MFGHTISLLLVFAVAACPLTCRVGELLAGNGAMESGAAPACCTHCCAKQAQDPTRRSNSELPFPACPCESECRDCICCGAVIDTDHGFQPPMLPSLDLPTGSVTAAGAARDALYDARPTLDGPLPVISGRTMRTLISSLLC